MKEFHAKKWLNEEFKKYDMWLIEKVTTMLVEVDLVLNTDVRGIKLIKFMFEDGQWVAIPKTLSFGFLQNQIRLICSTVDELNRQHDMEMVV